MTTCKRITTQPPRIKFTGRDFTTIVAELEEYVRLTRPQEWSDFFRANLGQTLIEAVALQGDMLAYGQDSVASELFLHTMRRRESAVRFAKSIGYPIRAATAAEVTVDAVAIPLTVTAKGGLIPAGTSLSGPTGVEYESKKDVYVPPGSTAFALTLTEGKEQTDQFTGNGQPDQTFTTERAVVEDGSWSVFVGAVIDDNKWEQVDTLTLAKSKRVYEATFTGDGRLQIKFGGRTAAVGAVLPESPTGTITVKYRTTRGAEGNAPLLSVRGGVGVEVGVVLSGDGLPIPGSGDGTIETVQFENSNAVATGGQDGETLDEMRRNIPAFIRSVDKFVTRTDYDPNVERSPGVGVALAFSEPYVSSFLANHVKVHVWASEDVTFTSETPGGSINPINSTAEYRRYSQFPASSINDLRGFMFPRSMVSVNNVTIRPTITWVDLYFDRVTFDPSAVRETVHAAVTKAVVELFECSSGLAIQVSDVYDAVEGADGVDRLYIERIVVETQRVGAIKFGGGVAGESGSTQPVDGDTVALADSRTTAPKVFEFDDDSSVAPGNIAVAIGATVRDTVLNFQTAVEAALNIRVVVDIAAPWVALDYPEGEGDLSSFVAVSGTGISLLNAFSVERLTVREDHRRDQNPISDPYPPGSPPNDPANYDPPDTLTAGGGLSPGWQDGGILPYRRIEDVRTMVRPAIRRYYDETFLYNNEIRYDSTADLNASVTAINLRRLVFDLEPKSVGR